MRTVKDIVIACIILFTAMPAYAEPMTLTLGIGRLSCANWLNTPSLETDAHGWILGYWTAMNIYSSSNRLVGQTTDSVGIVAEVRLACGQRPSERVFQIVSDVHQRLEREGR